MPVMILASSDELALLMTAVEDCLTFDMRQLKNALEILVSRSHGRRMGMRQT